MKKKSSNSIESESTGAGMAGLEWADELQRRRHSGPRMSEHRVLEECFNGISTMAIHAGGYTDPVTGSVGTPIFQGSTFLFSERTYEAFHDGMTRDIPIYSRYGNPTQWAVQEKIAALEGAESSLVFSSGMAAITSTILSLTSPGGHVVTSRDLYGGTYNFMREDMHRFNREVSFVDPTNIDDIENAIKDNTQMLFFEVLTNPLLKTIPLKPLCELAKRKKLFLVVDNTFLTPYCLKPLEFGAHIVIHSATKYLNGHSDLIAGVASGSRKYMDRVWQQMLKFGGSLNPMDCFFLERGLKTLAIRMRAHHENASAIVNLLVKHPQVRKVHSPLTPYYPYPWAKNLLTNGAAGLISFEVIGGNEGGQRFMDNLRLAQVATSLGGVESLVSMPFNTSHSSLSVEQLKDVGIESGLVRLALGIEDVEDLINDISQALDAV